MISSIAESFDIQIEKLYISDIKSIAQIENFQLQNQIPNFKEFKLTIPIYKFFRNLEELSKENKIFEEINEFKEKMKDSAYLSFLNCQILKLFTREISLFKFLIKMNEKPGLLRLGIRYSILFILLFPELGNLDNITPSIKKIDPKSTAGEVSV